MRRRKKSNEGELDDFMVEIWRSQVWGPKWKHWFEWEVNLEKVVVNRTYMSPFGASTGSSRVICCTQRQPEKGASGNRTPDCVLVDQSCAFIRLGWGDREPFSKLCRGGLCGWGEALPTTVKLHRVYLYQAERGSCLLCKAGTVSVFMKVTFMPHLTIAHILEIPRICSQRSEAVKARKKWSTRRKWKKSFRQSINK